MSKEVVSTSPKMFFVAAKNLSLGRKVLLRSDQLYNIEEVNGRFTYYSPFEPKSKTDFISCVKYGKIEGQHMHMYWILAMDESETNLKERNKTGHPEKIPKPVRKSFGEVVVPLKQLLLRVERQDTKLKKMHLDKSKKEARAHELKKIVQNQCDNLLKATTSSVKITDKDKNHDDNDDKDVNDQHRASQKLDSELDDEHHSQAELTGSENKSLDQMCLGTCDVAMAYKRKLEISEKENDSLKKKLKSFEVDTTHVNLEEIVMKLGKQLGENVKEEIAKLPVQPKQQPCMLSDLEGEPLPAGAEEQPDKVHCGDNIFISKSEITKISLDEGSLRKRVARLLKAMYGEDAHKRYLSGEASGSDHLPITVTHVRQITAILLKMQWFAPHTTPSPDAVRLAIRKESNILRMKNVVATLPAEEIAAMKEAKRLKARAYREAIKAKKEEKAKRKKSHHKSKKRVKSKHHQRKNCISDASNSETEDTSNEEKKKEGEHMQPENHVHDNSHAVSDNGVAKDGQVEEYLSSSGVEDN